MTFVCTVSQGGFRLHVFRAGVSGIVVVNIGHDDTEPLNYSAVVGIEPLPSGSSELFFHIVEADGATGAEHPFYSGKNTKFISDPKAREEILVSILTALKTLFSTFEPDECTWFTIDDNLPQKALLKFRAIRQTVERCGYVVASTRLKDGRRAWRAKRIPDAIDIGEGEPNPIDLRK